MTRLTDTLEFDEWLPLDQQPAAVQRFVAQVLATPPSRRDTEDCGAGLSRPVREIWTLPAAEVVRCTTYYHAPAHPACFAGSGIILILRPRLV